MALALTDGLALRQAIHGGRISHEDALLFSRALLLTRNADTANPAPEGSAKVERSKAVRAS